MREDTNFRVNLLMFLSFVIVAVTGFLRWVFKPSMETGILAVIAQPVCRLFGILHRWSGLMFVLLALYHIYVHWNWFLRAAERPMVSPERHDFSIVN